MSDKAIPVGGADGRPHGHSKAPRPSTLLFHLRSSLRAKVTLGVALPLLLILGGLAAIQYRRHRTAILDQLSLLAENAGLIIESSLRHEMAEEDRRGIRTLFESLTTSDQFRVVYLLNPSGQVVLTSNGVKLGTKLDNSRPDCQPCHGLAPETRPASVVVTASDGQQVFRSMRPIRNGPACTNCHEPDLTLLGSVLLDIPTAPLERELAAGLREDLLWLAATLLITVAVANAVLSRLVTRRIGKVSRAVARFGRGHRNLRLPGDSPDEIGQLAEALNAMGNNIDAEEARNLVLSDEVRRRAADQRNLLVKLITAQEEERRRVAQNLHDDLGQDLAGLAVNIQAVQQLWAKPPEPVRDRLQEMRTRIAEMTDHAYELILALRPSALDDLGLVPALRAHAERILKGQNIHLDMEVISLRQRLPTGIETTVFRVLQEALSNVVRHSRASRVRIVLGSRNGVFVGEMVDDGCGFDPDAILQDASDRKGLGILGMRERVALSGGRLEVTSQPGTGTRLLIRIPLEVCQ